MTRQSSSRVLSVRWLVSCGVCRSSEGFDLSRATCSRLRVTSG